MAHLHPGGDAVLHHPVVAGQHVAAAHVVTLEDHRRVGEVKPVLENRVGVEPGADRHVGAVAALLALHSPA